MHKITLPLFIFILMFTSCGHPTPQESDMDIIDNVKEALSHNGHVDIGSLQRTRRI